jgi:hypothetical protein
MSDDSEEVCKKCGGSGMVKERNGSVHVCYDCLAAGRLDVHSKDVKSSGIKV